MISYLYLALAILAKVFGTTALRLARDNSWWVARLRRRLLLYGSSPSIGSRTPCGPGRELP